jgi:hypothetical protein
MNRKIWFLWSAFAAVALGTATALPAVAAPETTGAGGVADAAMFSVAAALGDDLFSTIDLTSAIDPAGAATQHYGPYASGSGDSGTCGPNWANDTFDRHFTVHRSNDGTFTVVEQFKDGNFVTIGGASPGACDTNPGGTVDPGVTGSLHGYFIIPLPAGTSQLSTDSSCVAGTPSAPCTTGGFIDSHFSCVYLTTCFVSTFFDHYVATDQGLIFHEWKNASTDRGGNHGDIANT